MKQETVARKVSIRRKTNEVDISGELVIDGEGITQIKTGIEPLDHLLTVFAFHGFFNLSLSALGDLQHHILEDIGIALGKAVKASLSDMEGIARYGFFSLVMDKVVVEVNIDISGRPVLHRAEMGGAAVDMKKLVDEPFDNTKFTFTHAQEFLEAFVHHAGISMVYIIKSAEGDVHHITEALFKALGKALDQATRIDRRRKGVPSTKGVID